MNTLEYLLDEVEADKEFAAANQAIAVMFQDWPDIPEQLRRVAYYLVTLIDREKMPGVAQKARVSTGKCYELVKDLRCRRAQEQVSAWLLSEQRRTIQHVINDLACKIARLAREKKLAAPQFTNDMRRVSRAAEAKYQFTPIEFYYLGINQTRYFAENLIPPDRECLDQVKAQLQEIDPC